MSAKDPQHAAAIAEDLRSVIRRLKRKLFEQTGNGSLSSSQTAIVYRLDAQGAATVSDLARAEGMKPQSMSTIILSLEQLGFVAGAADPSDGRKTLMSLTRQGAQWLRKSRAARQDWIANKIQSQLSASEKQQLSRTIRLLERLLND